MVREFFKYEIILFLLLNQVKLIFFIKIGSKTFKIKLFIKIVSKREKIQIFKKF